MRIEYCELKTKEVVSICDGKKYGRIFDLVIESESGKINGIVLLNANRGLFKKCENIFVPWGKIVTIGDDVILIDDKNGDAEV